MRSLHQLAVASAFVGVPLHQILRGAFVLALANTADSYQLISARHQA